MTQCACANYTTYFKLYIHTTAPACAASSARTVLYLAARFYHVRFISRLISEPSADVRELR
ncbi:hypothetical protein L209DRAFT_754030 [Thermothelomyces heterothallicus CBS 203.75]